MFGITERGDAGLDFSWKDKLDDLSGAIIISKNLNDELIQHLINHKNKIIFHHTVTGYGASSIELNVPDVLFSIQQAKKLFDFGFPKEQYVLRVDPVIPMKFDSYDGIEIPLSVVNTFLEIHRIKRIRFSFMDDYKHIRARFKKAGINYPNFLSTFTREQMNIFVSRLCSLIDDDVSLETCAESMLDARLKIGCVSNKDYAILGLDTPEIIGKSKQRKDCLCLDTKQELLTNKRQCPHRCLYCYWI